MIPYLRSAFYWEPRGLGQRLEQLEAMARQCQDLADQDYKFLYDASRNLLVIGYDVTKRKRDESFYDLLASESRLASFIGIAYGKLPMEHWFSLGRLITIRRGKTMLLSWGGSMSNISATLVMPGYEHTLLGQTCEAIVDLQIDYRRKRGCLPWGISRIRRKQHRCKLQLSIPLIRRSRPGI